MNGNGASKLILMEEANDESISMSALAPLSKKQTTAKRSEKAEGVLEEKMRSLGYQIVEEVGVVTPLDLHPSKLSECISSYRYQRHPAVVAEPDFKRKDTK